jgi:hypothetical protein
VEDALSRNSQFALLIFEFAFLVADLFLAAKNKSPVDKDYLILKRAALSRPPANGMTTISMCWRAARLWDASSRRTPHQQVAMDVDVDIPAP